MTVRKAAARLAAIATGALTAALSASCVSLVSPTSSPAAAPSAGPPVASSTPEPTAAPTQLLPPSITPVSAVPTFSIAVVTLTPTATGAAAPLTTPRTGATNTPRPPSSVNLKPVSGPGGKPPLSVRSADGGPLASKADVLVDWFVGQDGTDPAGGVFFVDLYLDAVPVNRWRGSGFPLRSFLSTQDWGDLLEEFDLAPGEHTLKLVVDPTDLVNESNEMDNSASVTFTWAGPAPARAASKKQPNLAPGAPGTRTAPLIASPDPSARESGRLSVDTPTYIVLGVANRGVASVRNAAAADLYLDGVWLDRLRWDGLVAGSTGHALWDKLSQTVRVSPGQHTLRLVIDPSDLVAESNEADNVYEAAFTWSENAPQPSPPTATPTAQTAPARTVKTQPDFAPFVPYGWDAAITATSDSGAGAEGRDGPLAAGLDAYVSYTFWNASPVSTGHTFRASLYIDGQRLDTQDFAGGSGDSGSSWKRTFKVAAGAMKPGPHVVRVHVDPLNEVPETDEANNLFERKITWLDGALPAAPKPVTYTDAQLRALLAPVNEMMLEVADIGGINRAAKDWTQSVLDAAEAGYYLVTGRSIKDERIVIHMLPRAEYDASRLAACLRGSEAMPDAQYQSRFARCTKTGTREIGFKTRLDGRVHVFADTGHSPAQVLATLFHELGHARQDFANPALTEAGDSPLLSAVQEAAAQIFEAAAWRRIEDLLGTPLLSYPDFAAMRKTVQSALQDTLDGAFRDEEHDFGYLLMWLTALADPAGLGLAGEITARGVLSAAATSKMFDYVAGLPPSGLGTWAMGLLARQQELFLKYHSAALARLKPDLPQDAEGHPDLLDTAIKAP